MGRPKTDVTEAQLKLMGDRIKECIEAKGMTQESFGEAIGYSQATVNAWVNGKARALFNDLELLGTIANTLDVNMLYLRGDISVKHIDDFSGHVKTGGEMRLVRTWLSLMLAMGHDIRFRVLKDGSSKEIEYTAASQMVDVNLRSARCWLYGTEGGLSEGIVNGVVVDGFLMSYGCFTMMMKRMWDSMDSIIDGAGKFAEEYQKGIDIDNRK